jgi:hypothetical protein
MVTEDWDTLLPENKIEERKQSRRGKTNFLRHRASNDAAMEKELRGTRWASRKRNA